MVKYQVDHVCILTAQLERTITVFEKVFGMEVFKTAGTAPSRKVWLDGGIQLNETEALPENGIYDHIAINVPFCDQEALFAVAEKYGCTQAEGLKAFQWIRLPEGQLLELTDLTLARKP